MNQGPVTIERSVIIEADPETVFSYLIDPKLMTEWFGISHVLEAKPGGTFRVEVSPGNVAIGVFTEVTPSRRVAFTWGWESASPILSTLRPGTSASKSNLSRTRGKPYCDSHIADCQRIWHKYTASAGSTIWIDWRCILLARNHKHEYQNNPADDHLQGSASQSLRDADGFQKTSVAFR